MRRNNTFFRDLMLLCMVMGFGGVDPEILDDPQGTDDLADDEFFDNLEECDDENYS